MIPGDIPLELYPVKRTTRDTDLFVGHAESTWMQHARWFAKWLVAGFVITAVIDLIIRAIAS